MSRGSQNSLVSTRGHGQSAKTTREGGGSMKCIITVGILLPIVAAIIGIAAWSISSDSVHKRSQPSTIYHGSRSYYRNGEQIFEERNDDDLLSDHKVPIGGAISKDILLPDVMEERDVLPPTLTPEVSSPEQDPLYVVHYVPREPHAGGGGGTSEPPVPSPPPDVLSKIIASGKTQSGKGTPQFVVFAPMPNQNEDEEEYEDDYYARLNRKKMNRRRKMRKDEDLEEYTETANIRQHIPPPQFKATVVPRAGFFETSSEYMQNNGYHQMQQQQVPCCNQQMQNGGGMGGGMGGNMGGGMGGGMQQPAEKGVTITLGEGQGLPLSPLGLLRSLLKPKVDLKKKLFFGVQLENGIGFGGEQGNNGGNGGQMGGNGGQMGGIGGQMGGKMGGQMGGQMGGGRKGNYGRNGNGMTLHFGKK